MQHLEVSGAVRHIYIYIYVVRQLRVKLGRFTRSTPGKVPQYLTNRRLGGPQGGSVHFGEKETNVLFLLGFKAQTVQSVGWSLYRLSYPGPHLVI